MLVSRAFVRPERVTEPDEWPFTVPAVHQLLSAGISFERPVTFLFGENGSGKSTLIEALAEAYGLDARGGKAGRKYGNERPKTPLGDVLDVDRTAAGLRAKGKRRKRKGYFLRAETAFGFMEAITQFGVHGYWTGDVTTMSHGEGFLHILDEMFTEPGLYLMDEPESALSFSSELQLVALTHRLGAIGAQVICATHSPILAACPGADILELTEQGVRRTTWEDLQLVDHWRRYLANPTAYLRHLIGTEMRNT